MAFNLSASVLTVQLVSILFGGKAFADIEIARAKGIDGKAPLVLIAIGPYKKPSDLLNKMFDLRVEGPCVDGWRLERFDAQMPEHKHGMFVKPTVSSALESKVPLQPCMVRGVKLHMRGYWEFILVLKRDDAVHTVELPLQL